MKNCTGYALLVLLSLPAWSRAQSNVIWVEYRDCPVILENFAEVPAKETGQLEKLSVELNATVKRGQALGNLEQEIAAMEVKIAKLQQAAAEEQASDDGPVKLFELAHKDAVDDLENHKAISNSVAAIELRKKQLAVAQALVQLQTAEKNLKRTKVQAELASATVQAASLRLNNRQILAPIDGIVTSILTRPGQWVEAGKPVLVISDLQNLQVDCLIPIEKVDVRRVVGLPVRAYCTQRAAGTAAVQMTGRITSYDPKLSSQGEIRVHSRIENQKQDNHWLLLPGMTVRLEVGIPAGAAPALMSKRPDGSNRK